jgi:ERCC4-related helicase
MAAAVFTDESQKRNREKSWDTLKVYMSTLAA